MSEWDVEYYLHQLRQMCQAQDLPQLSFPKREYIVQIARFDPSKGIPDVIRSYAKYREMVKDTPSEQQLQLVIAGHGSIDDPDGTMIYDQTLDLIHKEFKHFQNDIIVIRLLKHFIRENPSSPPIQEVYHCRLRMARAVSWSSVVTTTPLQSTCTL